MTEQNEEIYNKNKENRLAVYFETVTIAKQKFYVTKNKHIVMLPSKSIIDSKFYRDKIDPPVNDNSYDEKIIVENDDSLYMAKKLIDKGYHPAVLNMASGRMPGGGVLRGSGAQEEDIFRRSNLFESLYQFHPIGKEFDIDIDKNHMYPLDTNYGGIYSKNITVFREGADKNYDVLEKPFNVDVISVAAINRPKYDGNFNLADNDIQIEKNKIRTILNLGLINLNDSLVLGAFGCGAFKTPPQAMAKCFHEVLDEKQYKNKFKLIAFAILDNKKFYKEHNPEGNLLPFKKEFK